VSVTAIGGTAAGFDISNGDDPVVLLEALRGARSAEMAKAVEAARDTLMQRVSQLQSLIDANFTARLQALPATPDGQGRILGDLNSGQQLQSGAPAPGTAIPQQAAALGFELPTQTWLQVAVWTSDSTGKVLSQAVDVGSPESIATLRAQFSSWTPVPTVTSTGVSGTAEMHSQTTGTGANAQTTVWMIYDDEGQVRATNADIAAFEAAVSQSIASLGDAVREGTAELRQYVQVLTGDMKRDTPAIHRVHADAETQHAAHVAELVADQRSHAARGEDAGG
jgi:hypothetical protein